MTPPLLLELGAVLPKVVGSGLERQVRDVVVQRVPVLVVDDHPARDGAVRLLPHKDGARLPHVGFGDLHPGAPITAPLMAGTNGDRPDGQPTDRDLTRLKGAGMRRPAAGIHRIPARHRAVRPCGLAVVEADSTLRTNMLRHRRHVTVATVGTGTK